ncbi:MAG: chromosome segregation protein SMC [Burkholderiaceae bacterium]|nr:chromosome segregation protein SMC [Burkholderiaceae bacterium]
MRLKQIRLAGFKSFVDPTSLDVPGQLVGVVGPNGCGKSNLIDAVRWVLGESKASELRGESMQDVIFSGSSERKPGARASVELVFDNSLGRIGGSWSQFAEISVRRVLTRDGQSNYFINNQPVRRRDVHDMFLGTGLGPRAYAIIGQGMISRIIEARPEELRVFLEEAAGVSKYKERRRETANRLADTRENLTRVDDIRRELGAQIERLQRQAEVAREFRSLEAERERKQHSVWLLRRDEADAEQRRVAAQAAEAANQVEARLAEQRAIEAEIETVRAAHFAAGDAVHAAQGRYYECNAQVGRIEAEIRLVSETQGQLRERLDSVERAAQRAQEQHEHARRDREAAHAQRTQAHAHAEELSRIVTEQAAALPEFESQAREARARVEEARQLVGQTRQSIELCALHERKASEALDVASRRRERLRVEADALRPFDALELERAIEALGEAEEGDRQAAERLAVVEPQWSALEAQRQPAQQALREAEARRAQLDGRLHALRQLQERVESQAKVQPWLARHGLERLARLYEKVRIDEGWESAVESVLRERVHALEVGRLDTVAGLAGDAPPSKVGFFAPLPSAAGDSGVAVDALASSPGATQLRPLARVVHAADADVRSLLSEWLAGCYTADSLESALAQRASLPRGGHFVVADGHVVGRQSVGMYAADSEQEGVLARRHEIENLQRALRAQDLQVDEARNAAARIESGAAERLAELTGLRAEHAQRLQRISVLRLDLQRLEQERDATAQSRERIDAELAELAAHIDEHEATIAAETERFEALDAELAQRQEQAESLQLALEDVERALGERREALRRDEREAQEASFAVRAAEASIERLDALIEQAIVLGEQAAAERASLRTKLDELTDASARHALQEALEARTAAEQALTQARARLDDLGHSLREREDARLVAERAQEPLRQRLGKLQLDEQAARMNREQFAQSLADAGLDEAAVEALRTSLADAPRPSWLQGEVTRLSNAIAALGAVNLAALEELAQAEERKGFLDAQSSDLEEAIGTLEDAIRKIDRETRELLQQTYDTVNGHFAKLFPELFGGGEARLILTGDEILDAGIQVLAQPPGKRNTSIQLLSGGEKALTAIALVFALFQLNPAPFCLLDEVDAPLDDANTERYCEMVRRMSEQTQFLFITHNKIAMELAQQLVGVTMQERGVSRIVAVDLDAATRYAEAA